MLSIQVSSPQETRLNRMSKLGLNKAKQAGEPPDKKRKTEAVNLPIVEKETAWDDDDDNFELVLTQQAQLVETIHCTRQDNQTICIDDLIASQQVCPSNSIIDKNTGRPCVGVGFRSTKLSGLGSGTICVGKGSSRSYSAGELCKDAKTTGLGVAPGPLIAKALSCSATVIPSNTRPVTNTSTVCTPRVSVSNSVRNSGDHHTLPVGTDVNRKNQNQFRATVCTTTMTCDVGRTSGVGDLMPSCATTGSGTISPGLPNNSAQNGDRADVSRIREECEYYRTELDKLKGLQYEKDGQNKMLRDKLDRTLADLTLQKQEMLKYREQSSKEKTKRELEMELENERLRTQIQFRDHEVSNLQTQVRRLEKKPETMSSEESQRRSPRGTVARSPSTPRLSNAGAFPTADAFTVKKAVSPVKVTTQQQSVGDRGTQIDAGTMLTIKQTRRFQMKLMLPDFTCSKGRQRGCSLVSDLMEQSLESVLTLGGTTPAGALKNPKSSDKVTISQLPATQALSLASDVKDRSMGLVCLARQGIRSLLNRSATVDTSTDPNHFGLLETSNQEAVLILPLLEDHLLRALNRLQGESTPSHSSSTTGSNVGSLDSVVRSPSRSPQSNPGSELEVRNSLNLLRTLVRDCRHVRSAIINCLNSSDIGSSSHVRTTEQSESASVLDSTLSTSRCTAEVEKVMRHCRLLDIITQLAICLQSLDKPGCCEMFETCMKILTHLAESSTEQELPGFVKLLESDCLLRCLGGESSRRRGVNFGVVISALKFLHSVVRSRSIAFNLCTLAGDCLLLALYMLCTKGIPDSWPHEQITHIHSLMFSILSCIISCHPDGSKLLLQRNCDCSAKVVKDVVRVLQSEYEIYLGFPRHRGLLVLRQGVSVLHWLTQADKATAGRCMDFHDEYASVLYAVGNLFRAIPDINQQEVTDIWNMAPELFSRQLSLEDDAE